MGLGGGWARKENHIKFPFYIRHLYGDSIDIHVLDFKWKSVNFDNLFRKKKFWPTIICSHKIVSHTYLWYKTLAKGCQEI